MKTDELLPGVEGAGVGGEWEGSGCGYEGPQEGFLW